VIPLQPDLGDRAEAMITGDLRDREMAVVIDDGEAGHMMVIEVAGDVCLQQEVFVDERRHAALPSTSTGSTRGTIR
jgi:hypothetical protein